VRIAQVSIKNFRGISEGTLTLPGHVVLIGDNNSGKSSVIEAIDLALGPDRINRVAAIDEHDFHAGRYLDGDGNPIPIEIEVTIVDLSPEQIRHFKGNIEFWNETPGVRGFKGSSRSLVLTRRLDSIPKAQIRQGADHVSAPTRRVTPQRAELVTSTVLAGVALMTSLYLFITLSPTSCCAGCPSRYTRPGQPAQASLYRQMAHSQ
jgi:predicted ATP-dependent endonuclease of OLD family